MKTKPIPTVGAVLAVLFATALSLFAQSTKVGGSGSTKVGGSGTTKIQPTVVASNTVTIDAIGTAVSTGSAWTTINTITVAVSSHSNRVIALLVGAGSDGAGNTLSTPTSNQGGTFVSKAVVPTGAGWGYASIWVMTAPTVATHTITVTVAAGGTFNQAGIVAISLYNVDQVTPTGTQSETAGTSATPTTNSLTLGTGGMAFAIIGSDSEASCGTSAPSTVVTGFPFLNLASDTSIGAAYRTSTGTIGFTTAAVQYSLAAVPFNSQ